MSIDSRNILNYQAGDADHRIFAQAIHDMIIAAGLTQTADTGQANIATLVRPAQSTVSGYEIFRFNDAEQATLACFLKIEYGTGASILAPALRITVGTGTNGAGVLSNALIAPGAATLQWGSSADSPAQVRPAFASYAEGQFVLAFGLDGAGSRGVLFYTGRPRAYDGSRTTDGLLVLFKYTINSGGCGVIRAGGGGPTLAVTLSDWPGVDLLGGMDDQVGANVALFPLTFTVNGNTRFASIFNYRSAVIAADAVQAINIFGSARNYRTMGGVIANNDASLAVPYF